MNSIAGNIRYALGWLKCRIGCDTTGWQHIVTYPVLKGTYLNALPFFTEVGREGTKLDEPEVVQVKPEEVSTKFVGWEDEVMTIVQVRRNRLPEDVLIRYLVLEHDQPFKMGNSNCWSFGLLYIGVRARGSCRRCSKMPELHRRESLPTDGLLGTCNAYTPRKWCRTSHRGNRPISMYSPRLLFCAEAQPGRVHPRHPHRRVQQEGRN